MHRRDILLGSLGLALAGTASVTANAQQAGQKRFALILANQTYEKNPLPNIRNDALLMDKTLKGIGFTTTVVLDGTRTTMLDGIRRFKASLTPGAFVLLYYSGHGAQVDGENYLIPTDNGNLDDADAAKDQCIPLGGPNGLLEKLGRTPGQLNLIILDACRDDPFPAATKSQGSKGLAVVARPVSGDYIAMAASPGQTASANPKGMNSLYTQELVQRLATPGLRLEDVFIETRNAVVASSGGKQVPQEFGTLTAKVFLAGANPNPNPGVEAPAAPIARISTARFSSASSKIRDKYPRLADYVESLCVIPAGEFQMGGIKDVDEDEVPVHKVRLSSFGLGGTPVTVAIWKEYANAKLGGVMPNDPKTGAVDGVKYFNVGWTDLDHPIVNVTWDDCRKFCAWASEVSEIALDLPSEAQWEYACRGGKAGQEFQWGGATDDVSVRNFLTANVWCSDNKIGDRGGTGSVNRTSRVWRNHPWLLVDMVGNVWEWCLDYYDSEWYSRAHASGIDIVNRTSAPARKRTLPDGTTMESPIRCFRGGSWNINDPVWFRSSTRSGDFPNRKNSLIGFRLAAGPG